MYLHSISSTFYKNSGNVSGNITIFSGKDESDCTNLTLTPAEAARFQQLGLEIFAERQKDMIADMSQPIHNPLLAPPEAEYREIDLKDNIPF